LYVCVEQKESKKKAQAVSQNLTFFYCFLQVWAFGKASTRQLKIKIQKNILHPTRFIYTELPLHV